MKNYPFGKTNTIFVFDMATGALLRTEDQRKLGKPADASLVESDAEVTIDADAIRRRVSERQNLLTVSERDYEGI